MKPRLLIILIGCILFSSFKYYSEQDMEKYYYAFDKKVPLTELKEKAVICFNQSLVKEQIISKLRSIDLGLKGEWRSATTLVITSPDEFVMKKGLDTFAKMAEVKSVQPMYTNDEGLEMGVCDDITVRFKENVSKSQIEAIINKYSLTIAKTTKIYTLLITPKGADALQIANKIQESGLVIFSHPNFVAQPELYQIIPNDSYFNNQFYLHNTGQVFNDGHSGTIDADIDAPEAWTITQGANNIIVAVLDEGVSSDHPDLPNIRQVRLNGSNFADGDPNNPSPTNNQNHGNSCAGIIAANMNNGQGIAGIAPNCRIMPIRIFDSNGDGILPDRLADAIEFAVDNGAHVLSNSWGFGTSDPNAVPSIVQAIQYAINSGRVVVFAAGNNARHTQGVNGFVSFPSNVNISGVITVGASERNDLQADYSPTSNLGSPNNQIIDVTAPSHRSYPPQAYQREGLIGGIEGETFEVWSIDIPGNPGYNPYPEFIVPGNPNTRTVNPPPVGEQLPAAGINFNNYTGRFGGTSAACPQVAGLAALILSINPNLTPTDVFNIITQTTDHVGGYTYSSGRCNELGYGRINSCRAVFQVVSTVISLSGPSLVCSSGATFTVNNLPSGISLNWENHSQNLEVVTTGTNNAVIRAISNNQTGFVEVTAISACGSYTLPRINNIYVGTQMPGAISYTMDAPPRRFSASAEPAPTATSYNWYSGGVLNTQYHDIAAIFSRVSPYCGHGYYVQIESINACGTSARRNKTVLEPPCLLGLTIYPNPASGNIEVTLENELDISDPFNESSNEVTIPTSKEFYVNVVDIYGSKVYSSKVGDKRFNLSVAGFTNGTYIVTVTDNKSTWQGTLIVNH